MSNFLIFDPKLPSLEYDDAHSHRKLAGLPAQFRIPSLTDRPQNPIMESLSSTPLLVPEVPTNQQEHLPITNTEHQDEGGLWDEAAKSSSHYKVHVLTWDALRPSMPRQTASPFLSEQAVTVFAAARNLINPQLRNPGIELKYVTPDELFQCLKMATLGMSSQLYIWNSRLERFVAQFSGTGRIVVDGQDEIISESIRGRFLAIGTLMRRLELFISSLRSRCIRDGPAVHAVAHALASILSHLRDDLAFAPPPLAKASQGPLLLASICACHAEFEDVLTALAMFCHRGLDKSPADYTRLNTASAPLLSRIYEHLHLHIERQATAPVVGIFAYLLTTASRDYIRRLCISVGYGPRSPLSQPRGKHISKQTSFDDDEEDGEEDGEDEDDIDFRAEDERYPSFLPQDLAVALPTARKSLRLLRSAWPDHPLFTNMEEHQHIHWFWTEEAVEAAWLRDRNSTLSQDAEVAKSADAISPKPEDSQEQDLRHQFDIFDLEPGSHMSSSMLVDQHSPAAASQLQRFLAAFPDELPSSMPTLSLLTYLVFSPLIRHLTTLSASLLEVFLSPTSPLNLHTHLTLLRSYLLLSSSSFKAKLSSALFSDSPDRDVTNPGFRSLLKRKQKPGVVSSTSSESVSWAVGLAPSLMEHDNWPPGGADLSFNLRSVIVDSLERVASDLSSGDEHVPLGSRRVLEEAESRLGFAIRDLPVGPGRDQWQDPLCIEALDFLYMNYKVPAPLTVLITPDIVSKYQRIFTFLLRLVRVDHAVRTVFRVTRSPTTPVLLISSSAHVRILHFRFIASSFVQALSEYVFDTAICANFDAFLARLSPLADSSSVGDRGLLFGDVYSLAEHHSAVMDDILHACLLKSGQRATGDVLREALVTILDFCILVGKLHLRPMKQENAMLQLETLFYAFRSKVQTLVRSLDRLVEKDGVAVEQTECSSVSKDGTRAAPGGVTSLRHLLLRLDTGNWWAGWQGRAGEQMLR